MNRFLSLIVIVAVGCASSPVNTSPWPYDIALSAVERQERGGEVQRFADLDGKSFEDEFVRIAWHPTEWTLDFTLTNKTDSSIHLDWQEVRYFGPEGKSDGVAHAQFEPTDRGSSMKSSVVKRGGTLQENIRPPGRLSYEQQFSGTWDISPGSRAPLVGYGDGPERTIKVMIPIDAGGTRHRYLFQFSVKRSNAA